MTRRLILPNPVRRFGVGGGVVLALLAGLVWSGASLQAQTTVNNTTLSAAVSATTTRVTVASAATIVVNQYLFSDHELMLITAVDGTILTVQRGMGGTMPAGHTNGSIVYTGAGERFYYRDPPYGDCAPRAEIAYLPWINVRSGHLWTCDGANWRATNTLFLTYNSTITG